MLPRIFLKGEGTNQKTENVWSSSFIRGTKNPKDVLVCVAPFWRKMVTMPVGYFSLVALYYCKIWPKALSKGREARYLNETVGKQNLSSHLVVAWNRVPWWLPIVSLRSQASLRPCRQCQRLEKSSI